MVHSIAGQGGWPPPPPICLTIHHQQMYGRRCTPPHRSICDAGRLRVGSRHGASARPRLPCPGLAALGGDRRDVTDAVARQRYSMFL